MTPYFETSDVAIYQADSRTAWRDLPEHSADAIVTSPPYWGLRDYGHDGQIGLEDDPSTYIGELADLLTGYGERVLKPGGSLWLNLGDTYSSSTKGSGGQDTRFTHGGNGSRQKFDPHSVTPDFPAKCLLMIPERVALALIERGWILRNRVVWAKPNGMPSSAQDRLATKHEALFHLVRQQRYYYDLDAIREPHAGPLHSPGNKSSVPMTNHFDEPDRTWGNEAGKNPGDVWTIPTQPYPDAHFAVFPRELVRRPILATVPEQVCMACGAARQRIVERGPSDWEDRKASGEPMRHGLASAAAAGAGGFKSLRAETVGWSDCGCDAGFTSGTVLDPFFGSGTTAVAARSLGRKTVGVELSADYCALAAKRFTQNVLDFGGDSA